MTPGRRWTILLREVGRHRARFTSGIVLLVATNILALAIPWMLKEAVDAVQRRDSAGRVAAIAAGIGCVALVQALVRTLSRIAILGASRHIVYDLRNRFFERLIGLPAPFFDRFRTGDLMSRAVNDLMLIRSFFGPGIMNLANTILSWTGAVALMAMIDLRLTLWSLIPYPFVLIAMNRLSRALYRGSQRAQEQLAVISSRAQENLAGQAQVKAYDMAAREIEGFNALASELRARNLILARVRGAIVPLMGSVGGVGTLLVLWVGTRHVIQGTLSLGDFVAFNAYLASLAWPTIAMGWILNVFQRSQGALARISEVLDAEDPPHGAVRDPAPPPAGTDLVVKGLGFAYGGSGSPALEEVSFSVPPGGTLGIVGPVGSGKSTLLRLLSRLYSPSHGEILLGGLELDRIAEDDLRHAVAFVPQESFLFSMSLAENIALGRADAGRAEIEEAARRAGLARDLADLPQGWETPVGERGYTLSGGQRQRTALARALLVGPRILLLDDPFASVDAATEEAVLAELYAADGMTRIVAGHRVSAVARADEILVLDRGRIVERGTHASLIGGGGLYARLFERQRTEREIESA